MQTDNGKKLNDNKSVTSNFSFQKAISLEVAFWAFKSEKIFPSFNFGRFSRKASIIQNQPTTHGL